MKSLVAKVANQTGIPWQNVIDTEKVIKRDGSMAADGIHINEAGNGALAQEIYMRLAFSEPLKKIVDQITEGSMSLNQMISFMALEEKEIEKRQKLPKLKGQVLAQQQYVMTPILAETSNTNQAQ